MYEIQDHKKQNKKMRVVTKAVPVGAAIILGLLVTVGLQPQLVEGYAM